MMTLTELVIFFILGVFFHELGHYIAFRLYGIRPNISFKFLAIQLDHPKLYLLNSVQFFLILGAGILAGLPFMIGSSSLMISYMILISADAVNMILIVMLPKDLARLPLHVRLKKEYDEVMEGLSPFLDERVDDTKYLILTSEGDIRD